MKGMSPLLKILPLPAAYLVILSFTCVAQDTTDYYTSGYLRYDDFVYNKNIRTVVLEQQNLRLSDPVLELGRPEKLILMFDDLEADYKNYMYTLIHCDASWNPSPLQPHEYLSGFTEDRIIDYRTSFNTMQPYTHYEQEIPGREVNPFLSGNYLLKVYIEGAPETAVLTRRMMVLETRTNIEATVQRATIVNDMNTKQEIDFSVFHRGLQIANPFEDIKVVIQQNGRWDNAITGLKPLFLKGNQFDYTYDEENTFNGGNEFRTFDTRTIRMQTQFVENIVKGPDGYTVVLIPSYSRSFERYVTENDINGKFLVRSQDGRDSHLEGEYVKVKFRLRHEILTRGNFYVFGALTGWKTTPENKMTYNYDDEMYEVTLFLKQGYYDYEYVFLEDGSQVPDETIVEGNHFETSNEYNILVYYHAIGSRYHQLVGIRKLNSR